MNWYDLGPADALKQESLREIKIGTLKFALTFTEGKFGAISGICNHAAGPLGKGRLDGAFVVCPWHNWKFHCRLGTGEPGFEEDRVPSYTVKEENGHLFLDLDSATPRNKTPHTPHPLARPVVREAGPLRVVGISTTHMDNANPRYSTSDTLLEVGIAHAQSRGVDTRLLRLTQLQFRHCEGYYSKSARACTWPCSITQMDESDQMDQVYEALVHWADVVLVSTPIRWGAASSLYFKMVERMNCIQNQMTLKNNVLIRNKVGAFIITGGQDNIQSVAGGMLAFFSEIGFVFPPFPYVAHSLGWTAENMERNIDFVAKSEDLRAATRGLVDRSLQLASRLLADGNTGEHIPRGGRKAHRDRAEVEAVNPTPVSDEQPS